MFTAKVTPCGGRPDGVVDDLWGGGLAFEVEEGRGDLLDGGLTIGVLRNVWFSGFFNAGSIPASSTSLVSSSLNIESDTLDRPGFWGEPPAGTNESESLALRCHAW